MLGVQRVIGHKEWAGPRKSDPRHDMNWRRGRVGGFVPHGGGHPVIGAIKAAYDRKILGSAAWSFFLGKPKGPEIPTWDKTGRWQEFEKGAILWHPQVDRGTAHVVWGDILKKFWAMGAEAFFGYPVTDELATPDTVGRYNHFAGSPAVGNMPISIYFHPKHGSRVVQGIIRAKWADLGWETGIGYPTTDETTTPNKKGKYNHFSGRPGVPGDVSSIYWSPETGAHPVFGGFRKYWEANRWEAGPLGFPTSGEFKDGNVTVQNFQGGQLRAEVGGVKFVPKK